MIRWDVKMVRREKNERMEEKKGGGERKRNRNMKKGVKKVR